MDLGIAGRKALVCGASKGLGRGCAAALAREGVHVTLVARTAEALAQTVAELQEEIGDKARLTSVAADISTPEGRALALAACPEPDILVNNAGGPPLVISATGPATTGSLPSTPTCWRRSR